MSPGLWMHHKKSDRLIAVDLSRQNELDADLKCVHQIEFVGELKKLDGNGNATNAGNDQSMFVLTLLEKIKETRIRFSQGGVTVLQKMVNYEEARVNLTNTQLNKLKPAAKDKTGPALRITKKNFQDEELPHELFLTTT